ncbi:MAG: MFS transporter [Vulcanimicrobiaceae bacterium]
MGTALRLGLRPNLVQFSLLALDNVFVGMLVGSERTVVPLLGAKSFGITSAAVLLTFVVAFGVVKGPLNLLAGQLADRYGRRKVLLAGWFFGLPVPWLLLIAPSWGWIVAANLLLGANQGFAWSMTVTSKVDLVGRRQRGLALGINEFSGYVGVAIASAGTGALAADYGLRPAPFVFAAAVAMTGLLLVLAIRETTPFVQLEQAAAPGGASPAAASLGSIFADVSWRNPTMRACSQAGCLNKFGDTGIWVLLPLAMAAQGHGPAIIGATAGIYAFTWGIAQLGTGALSDRVGRKPPIVVGLVLDAAGLALAGVARDGATWFAAATLAGLGTALVYPVLLAAISDVAAPVERGTALGVYRLWRDGGYALGGLTIGIAAAHLNARGSFSALAVLLLASAMFVQRWMRETHNPPRAGPIIDAAVGRRP